jgi:hypothetical protein
VKTRDIEIYSSGVCALSVCVPNFAKPEEVETAVNEVHPTGIESKWKISTETFKDGTPNPCRCNDTVTRMHYLLNC